MTAKEIPSYGLPKKKCPVLIEDIGYRNPYDFTREHRHEYFEIILLEKGGGRQWIDFSVIDMQDHSCYLILPGQVHLLKRDDNTRGSVIQFEEISVQSSCLRNFLLFSGQSVIFEKNPEKYDQVATYLSLINTMQQGDERISKSGCSHLLHAFLFQTLGFKDEIEVCRETDITHYQFLRLVEDHFTENLVVQEYLSRLCITNKKLTGLTKKSFGMTPLQIIHNRLLLEAKRLLVFENNSYKELAFRLGFASPSRFSHFIKDKTGFSPGELRENLLRSPGAERKKDAERDKAA